MSKVCPSQYDCNNMEPGDVIYVSKQPLWYRLYRHYFLQNKIKIKVKEYDTKGHETYKIYYQEDCTLIYDYERKCTFSYEKSVPVEIMSSPGKTIKNKITLDNMITNLDTFVFRVTDNLAFKIPTSCIRLALNKLDTAYKQVDTDKVMKEQLKYIKHKGNEFLDIYKDKELKEWNVSYCSVCGNPIIFKFTDDGVIVINKCNCGNTILDLKFLTWDEFAIWYASQTNVSVKKLYERFWFGEDK